MIDLCLPPPPLGALRALAALRLRTPRNDAGPSCAKRAEFREVVFAKLSSLAHRHGLHIAPSVAMGSVFSVRDGRRSNQSSGARSALSHERVDILLLDRSAEPVLALTHATEDGLSRANRQRTKAKVQLFERAGLAMITLNGLTEWEDDSRAVEQRLAAITAAKSNDSRHNNGRG